jgi:hypothetical protein
MAAFVENHQIFGHILNYQNAPSFTVFIVKQFFVKKQIPELECILYSPNIAAYYFFIYPKLKDFVESVFLRWLDIQSNEKTVFKGLLGNHFQQCLQSWQRYWNACMESEGVTLKVITLTKESYNVKYSVLQNQSSCLNVRLCIYSGYITGLVLLVNKERIWIKHKSLSSAS